MKEGLNRVMLLGNLGANPELKFTQGGQAVLHMRLATTESYLDKDKVRRERTDWHNVVLWGKRGEALAKILSKGSALFVEGSLRTSSYDDRDGNKRYKTEVIVTGKLILCGGRPGQGGADEEYERGQDERGERPDEGSYGGRGQGQGGGRGGGGYGSRDDRSGGQGQGRGAPPAQDPPDDDGGGGYGGDDDIPF